MYKIRHVLADDLPFLVDSFLQSFYGAAEVRGCSRDDYFPGYRLAFKRLLARPTVEVRVACAEDDESTILGWACIEGDCLHYVLVRKDVRGLGLARDLVGSGIVRYSRRSQQIMHVPFGWRFTPASFFLEKL